MLLCENTCEIKLMFVSMSKSKPFFFLGVQLTVRVCKLFLKRKIDFFSIFVWHIYPAGLVHSGSFDQYSRSRCGSIYIHMHSVHTVTEATAASCLRHQLGCAAAGWMLCCCGPRSDYIVTTLANKRNEKEDEWILYQNENCSIDSIVFFRISICEFLPFAIIILPLDFLCSFRPSCIDPPFILHHQSGEHSDANRISTLGYIP